MTAAAPIPIASRRRPTRVLIDRHELVGALLDWQALTQDAMVANGAALQLLMRQAPGASRDEAIRATHETHTALSGLLASLRRAAGDYDRRPTTT